MLLLHCVFNREVRKHLRGVLAGKKPYTDDSATTRATLLTVGGARGPGGGPGLRGVWTRSQLLGLLPHHVDVTGLNRSWPPSLRPGRTRPTGRALSGHSPRSPEAKAGGDPDQRRRGRCAQRPAGAGRLLRGTLQRGPSRPPRPGGLHSAAHQPPALQRSLNCNNTYGEEPDMFRTALGESTASLDSTTRSGCAGRPAVAAGEEGSSQSKCQLCRLYPVVCPAGCVLLVGPGSATLAHARGQSRVTPSRAGALSPPSPLSRDEGGQKLSVSSGPARGGHGEPDASFVPRSAKKSHGTCPMVDGLPLRGPAAPRPPSLVWAQVAPLGP